MRLIKPSVEIIEQGPGLEGIYKQIEQAGRNCYQSSHLIKEGSAKPFVDRMIESGHHAMLEHGTVYLYAEGWDRNPLHHYLHNKYSRCYDELLDIEHCQDDSSYKRAYYVTTNLRVLVENGWLDDLKYVCDPTEHHSLRVTARFTTQIAITREFNRHRVNSIAEESTRYCNYSKDKFDAQIGINVPTWLLDDVDYIKKSEQSIQECCEDIVSGRDKEQWNDIAYWMFAQYAAEYCYMNLVAKGWPAQKARTVLPLDTNTTLVHTAFISDWEHFFWLRAEERSNNKPHPDAMYLATKLKEMFQEKGYIK